MRQFPAMLVAVMVAFLCFVPVAHGAERRAVDPKAKRTVGKAKRTTMRHAAKRRCRVVKRSAKTRRTKRSCKRPRRRRAVAKPRVTARPVVRSGIPSAAAGTGPSSAPAAPASAARPAPAALPAPSTRTPRYFGFNDNSVRANLLSAAANATLTAGAGANVSRITFDWRWVESRQGVRNFAQYDAIYAALRARGIRPVWIVAFAPQWAFDAGVACNQWERECRYPPAREHLGAWRSFVAEVAARYPEAAAIEIWNEPNLRGFFRPGPDAGRYVELLKTAHAAVKGVDPAMPVLGGALGNNQVNVAGGDVALETYLDRMYAAGARGSMDGISFHPYPWSLDLSAGTLFARSFDQVRAVRAKHGDAATPLWVTETGVSTSGLDSRYRFTASQQATASTALYRRIAAMPDVEAIMLHTLVEPALDATNIETGYGMVSAGLVPKPAYCAVARERGAVGPGCA